MRLLKETSPARILRTLSFCSMSRAPLISTPLAIPSMESFPDPEMHTFSPAYASHPTHSLRNGPNPSQSNFRTYFSSDSISFSQRKSVSGSSLTLGSRSLRAPIKANTKNHPSIFLGFSLPAFDQNTANFFLL